MKITVYFTLGDVLECENVKDTRRFWRMVSKHCKRFSYLCDVDYRPQRVERVVKVR